MKETRILMGMPITVDLVAPSPEHTDEQTQAVIDEAFAYFDYVDRTFSTYKEDSEISAINRHERTLAEFSADMQTVFALAEEMRMNTNGYFDIYHDGKYDPSGLVKGWAVLNAAELVRARGFENFYVEAGGDFQAAGMNDQGRGWLAGIRNPFNMHEIVKVLLVSDCGVATSGTSIRGQHIYNPKRPGQPITDVVSLTVIGPDVCAADCYATAAFAMGREGINFIERLDGFEGYQIDADRQATFTSGLERYVAHV